MNFKLLFVDKCKRFKLYFCDCGILCIDVCYLIVRNKNLCYLMMIYIDLIYRKVG